MYDEINVQEIVSILVLVLKVVKLLIDSDYPNSLKNLSVKFGIRAQVNGYSVEKS